MQTSFRTGIKLCSNCVDYIGIAFRESIGRWGRQRTRGRNGYNHHSERYVSFDSICAVFFLSNYSNMKIIEGMCCELCGASAGSREPR